MDVSASMSLNLSGALIPKLSVLKAIVTYLKDSLINPATAFGYEKFSDLATIVGGYL